MTYDPQKAHEYYLKVRQLKGRHKGAPIAPVLSRRNSAGAKAIQPKMTTTLGTKRSHLAPGEETRRAQARVGRLKVKLSKLAGALKEAESALTEKRRNAEKTKKQNSDGKTTAKERQASKQYRDKNKAKISAKEKKNNKGSSSGGGSTDVSSMTETELVQRVGKIQSAMKVARTQLSNAEQTLGSLAHSDIRATGVLYSDFALHSTISRRDSVKMTEDFSGYATRNNLRCSDGRTILADAFKENDGQIVPLVWQHGHDEPTNVLGHVKLENRLDGVYCRGFFNSTAAGIHAKEMVKHEDVKFLSIFANRLVERAKEVLKGNIREVSLVLAGANPGAFIDNVNLVHSDGEFEVISDEAYITTGFELELSHASTATDTATVDNAPDQKTLQDILDTLNEEQTVAVNYLLSQALNVEGDAVQHSETEGEAPAEDADADATDEDTDGDADADSDADADTDDSSDSDADDTTDTETDTEAGDAVQHDNIENTQEDDSMTHNVFDQAHTQASRPEITLSHDDIKGIVADAMDGGSLKRAVEGYALKHGIENIDYLFPDSKTLESSPAFLSRRMEWVDKVLSGVRKSPFSRIKTITADITPDEARARGYIKGNMKNEEYFALAKRETTPQTIYKKQKLDRDDVIDITDLDVVAWLKAEMKVMLDEELAGAILIGDGRSIGDDDKIKEANIRPIASDAELYVTTANVNLLDANSSVEELVDSAINNRQYYKGSGQPTFYTSESVISKFLTVKDSFGRRIYGSIAEVASVLRCADVVPVEIMDRVPSVVGIMVNLSDYTLGADRGGQATMFDDFDIDYNKLRYLIETRVSGALTQPKSAIVFREVASTDTLVAPVAPNRTGNVVTVPTVAGVVYKDGSGTTLTTGSPTTLTSGSPELQVNATPAAGKYFENNANDQWTYEYDAG